MNNWRANGIARSLHGAVIGLAAAAVLATGTAAAAGPTVRLFSGIDEHWVPLQVAVANGYFSDEGVDVELTTFTTGAAATEAFRSGRGDMIIRATVVVPNQLTDEQRAMLEKLAETMGTPTLPKRQKSFFERLRDAVAG